MCYIGPTKSAEKTGKQKGKYRRSIQWWKGIYALAAYSFFAGVAAYKRGCTVLI